jgi:hypothetical protein
MIKLIMINHNKFALYYIIVYSVRKD